MRSNPALTYRGALKLLGKTDNRLLNALDTLLGGLILASPASPVAALWEMVDQKNEAMTLVRKLVGAATKRMHQVKGYERYELITAAHTVIVNAAFFDAFRDALGKTAYAGIKLTEQEKLALVADAPPPTTAADAMALLVSADLPVASANEGLYNERFLRAYYRSLFEAMDKFVRGLDAGRGREPVPREVVSVAVLKYQSHFVELAADVPEFFIWATVAGLRQVQGTQRELGAALAEEKDSLRRLEEVLTRLSATFGSEPDRHRRIVGRANRSILTEAVVPREALSQITEVTFPPVERIYQSPRFRIANAGKSLPADENWWARQPVHDALDVFFASFLASSGSVSAPLLLLGHPGAGKSLLTKVLAARLPETAYTAVRVPLRRVDADAPVYEQIQQALDLTTNRRVNWADLAEEGDTTRVVFLDGLDELLQASSRGRASYLQEVAEFQRREAEQKRPVAFVVTSRTVVADQVRIADDTTVVKLEDFTDEQVRAWLSVWREYNQAGITAGRMGEISLDVIMKHHELARQPLLLMMLAVYAADPAAPPIHARMSNAAFYHRILDSFVRREVAKHESALDISEQVEDQMWRLGIAAFAMFNRDRQNIGDHELGLDILALTGGSPHTPPGKVGQDTISRFFFVYTAEADAHREDAQRTYEFLHATFGEYLVAHYSVKVLLEVAQNSRKTLRGGREYDDDLLFALLCHQSLTTRQSIVDFVEELFAPLSEPDEASCVHTLDALLEQYRNRPDSKTYVGYQPLSVDNVRRLAAYSANLVLLRTILAPRFEPPEWWTSTVSLWRAGLGSGWDTFCRTVELSTGEVSRRSGNVPGGDSELAYQQLLGDEYTAYLYQWGLAAGAAHLVLVGDRYPDIVAFLLRVLCDPHAGPVPPPSSLLRLAPDEALTEDAGERLSWLIGRYLAEAAISLDYHEVRDWVELAVHHTGRRQTFSVLAPAVAIHPELLIDVPDLMRPSHYDRGALLVFLAAPVLDDQLGAAQLRQLCADLAALHNLTGVDVSDDVIYMVRKLVGIPSMGDVPSRPDLLGGQQIP